MAALKIFGSPWVRPWLLFSRNFNGLFFRSILWICVQNLTFVVNFVPLTIPEKIGDPKKLCSPWIRPRSLFSKIFNGPCKCSRQIWSPYSFTCSWDNRDCCFWLRLPQSWATGGRRGSGMAPLERALVTSYRLPIVTFPLSLRVSEILPLLCSSTPLFSHPTSSLPKISPCMFVWE